MASVSRETRKAFPFGDDGKCLGIKKRFTEKFHVKRWGFEEPELLRNQEYLQQ